MPLSSDSKLDFENKNEIWIDCVLNELQISWMKTKYLRYLNSLKIIKFFSKFNRWKKKKKWYEKRIKKLWFFFDLYKFWIMTIEELRIN